MLQEKGQKEQERLRETVTRGMNRILIPQRMDDGGMGHIEIRDGA